MKTRAARRNFPMAWRLSRAADTIKDPEDRGKAVKAWARKRGVGQYDPRLQDDEIVTFGGEPLQGV